jgi:hypothetical protein
MLQRPRKDSVRGNGLQPAFCPVTVLLAQITRRLLTMGEAANVNPNGSARLLFDVTFVEQVISTHYHS